MDGGGGFDGWKAAILLLGVCFALGGFIARYLWTSHHDLVKKVGAMELHNVANNVTKQDLQDVMSQLVREHIAPLNRDMKALIKALSAQEIHVDRYRD
jgi:hypothetical protein